MITIKDSNLTMEELLALGQDYSPPALGSLIDGIVVAKTKNKILVDIGGIATGIISGKETHDSAGTIKIVDEGEGISAVVVEEENEEGMIVLSLRRASQQRAWERFVKAYNEGEMIEVMAQEVNKGGLLLEIDGIKAFIPVSQLAPLHYPRVNNANSTEIVSRLQKLIGEKFQVKIINIDQDNEKLILSEKEALSDERAASLKKLLAGQVVEGTISGVVNFGIFVTFDGLEGLVHISQIAWGHVSDPRDFGKVGDKVKVLVIGIEGEKISLSMKKLIEDPWIQAAEEFRIGKKVKGTINRITPFGAFMKLTSDINGLIHLSEISNQKVEDPTNFVSMGEEVEAKVIAVDLAEHRIGLSLKALKPITEKEIAEKTEKKIAEKTEKEKAEKTEEKEEKEEKAEKTEDEKEEKKKVAKKKVTKKKATNKKASKKGEKKEEK